MATEELKTDNKAKKKNKTWTNPKFKTIKRAVNSD
jgi:hypothetical protein